MHEKIPDINLFEIPVGALKPATIKVVGNMLNEHRVLCSPILDLPRDYRGIAHLMGVSLIVEGFPGENPIKRLLTEFGLKEKWTIGQLQSSFEKIDRFDVLDDTRQMFYNDAVEFETKRRSLVQRQPTINLTNYSTNDILTIDDMIRHQNANEGPQHYDLFILYVDTDRKFAQSIREKLETDLNLKVCDGNRDLAPSLLFQQSAEHEIKQLIKNRCYRLFVVLSNEFVSSTFHKSLVTDAQSAISEPQQPSNKVLLCTYKKCNPPSEYRQMVIANYARDEKTHFWPTLRESLLPRT